MHVHVAVAIALKLGAYWREIKHVSSFCSREGGGLEEVRVV